MLKRASELTSKSISAMIWFVVESLIVLQEFLVRAPGPWRLPKNNLLAHYFGNHVALGGASEPYQFWHS